MAFTKHAQKEIASFRPPPSVISELVCHFPFITSAYRQLPVIVMTITFFHNVTFNAGTFYLALFYQVRVQQIPGHWILLIFPFQAANGSTPLEAGFKSLPYSLGSSLASMPAAWFMNYWQQRTNSTRGPHLVVTAGLLISTLGFGASSPS